MDIRAIEATLLRDLIKQIASNDPKLLVEPLKVGDVLGARVSTTPAGERMLMLAGIRVPAELPADLVSGQAMKLRVTESSADKLVLQVMKEGGAAPEQPSSIATNQTQPTTATTPSPYAAIPMPGGANARVWVDPDLDADAAAQAEKVRARSMVVRYDSPELGRIDVVLRLDTDRLEATLLAPAGEPIARLRSSVPELRAALVSATEVPVALSTGGRTDEVIDVRV